MNKKNLIVIGAIIVAFVGMVALFSSTPSSRTNGTTEVAGEAVKRGFKGALTPNKFAELIDSEEYILVDIRTQDEYSNQRITSSPLLIDYYQSSFRDELGQLDKDEKYLIYCNSGNRSGSTVLMMEEFGFTNFYELSGGISAWNLAGLETFKSEI